MNKITFVVPNINCNHCVHTIETELSEMDGVKDRIDLDFQAVVRQDFAEGRYAERHDQGSNTDRDYEFVQAVAACLPPHRHLKPPCLKVRA